MLKQPVITKVAGERSKKAQSKELLKSVAVSVSPAITKIGNRGIGESGNQGIGESGNRGIWKR